MFGCGRDGSGAGPCLSFIVKRDEGDVSPFIIDRNTSLVMIRDIVQPRSTPKPCDGIYGTFNRYVYLPLPFLVCGRRNEVWEGVRL